MIAYEACVRLCLHSLKTDRVSDASYFLNNECTVMRNTFSLEKFFLQSEEELLGKRPSELVTETSAPKSKKTIGKIRLQGMYTFIYLLFFPYLLFLQHHLLSLQHLCLSKYGFVQLRELKWESIHLLDVTLHH